MKKVRIIYTIFFCALFGTFMGCSNNHTTIKEKIDKASCVTVELPPTLHMNLTSKRWYGNGHAVKKNVEYSYDGTYESKISGFYYYRNIFLLYPILADQTRVDEVKKSNYVIVKDVKNNSEQRKIINVWHDDGFKGYKVKVFYNQECLPVKVQLIDRETNKWKTGVKYTYPGISSQQYEKNWKEYLKEIKAGDFLDE
ncbi:hypothetical protein NR996_02835 [Lactobacillus rodentium]|uniref:Lipoprotein n=1 Tax=Lactobacillus rodentium TaxID=947835 RepID=A0A2Z6T7I0_9LACO|nr:hypothetical protein [Lactobacillus rodentium]MCR1894344.1 hypothetical protein [Lactobacillus rodentium]GBG04641.1 hypothetical protein LrDSM24759_05550 [Lactobacillus rodentium]